MEAISGVSMRNTDYARHVLPPSPIADGVRELLERENIRFVIITLVGDLKLHFHQHEEEEEESNITKSLTNKLNFC